MARIQRGRILRDTSAGDGLVFVDGNQYLFRLEGMWKSEFAPKVNMLVDVEFNDRGQLTALRKASVEDVAAEQTTQAFSAAKAGTRQLAQDVRSDAVPAIVQYAEAVGYPTLAAFVALLLGWFFFSAASMGIGPGGRIGITFYQALKLLNVRGVQDLVVAGTGIYGLICFLCCAAVLLPSLWRDRRANLGMLAPLAFMLVVGLLLHHKLSVQLSGFEQSASQFGPPGDVHGRQIASQMAAQFARNVATQVRNGISLEFGAYLSLAASLYLAWRGTQRFLHPDDGTTVDSDDDGTEPAGPSRSETTGRPVARVAPGQRVAPAKDYFSK